MTTVTIHEAKTNFSRLIEQVRGGAEIVIARGREPVAKLTALDNPAKPVRKIGLLKGKIKVPADFDAPLPEDLLKEFGV